MNQGGGAAAALCLERQGRLAAVLLFSPWLITLLFGDPLSGPQPATTIALLPGFGLAAYFVAHLHRHLRFNHPPGEGERLFPSLGTANWITLFRGAAVVGLAGFFPLLLRESGNLPGMLAWAPGGIYLALSLADGVDGLVARRQGRVSELGRQLDITIDAAALLVASLLAVILGKLPIAYLFVGTAYYIFLWGIRWRQRRRLPLLLLTPRPYARTIAGFHMGLVGVALLPAFSAACTFPAAYIFMLPLLAGFCRDWLVVSCRLPVSGAQHTAWDRRSAKVWFGVAPLAARLLLASGGVMAFSANAFINVDPLWSLALAGGSLAGTAGFAGRPAAVILLLLLGLDSSPFGTDFPALLIFNASAILALTGTGPFSLWVPWE